VADQVVTIVTSKEGQTAISIYLLLGLVTIGVLSITLISCWAKRHEEQRQKREELFRKAMDNRINKVAPGLDLT
jgi:hypothetical protein